MFRLSRENRNPYIGSLTAASIVAGIFAVLPQDVSAETARLPQAKALTNAVNGKAASAASKKPPATSQASKPVPAVKDSPANDTASLTKIEAPPGAKPAADSVTTSTPSSSSIDSTKSNESASCPATEAASSKKKKGDFPDVLPCLSWPPEDDPKAAILCVHGLGLSNDSYREFGERMAKQGYLVYSVDVPGFGSFQKADQGRDRVNFDYCLKGIAETLTLLHKVNRKLPIFVLGESMGGAIALRVTSEHPELVDGLISSVPSGDRFKQGKEALRVGLKLLTNPNKPFDIGTDVIKRATEDKDGTVNEKLRESWTNDPLNRMELTPKELLRFQGFMGENFDNAGKVTTTPVLFVQGCKDMLVRPQGTQELFNAINSPDRKIELIHDKGHLIFEEGQFDDHVIQIVDEWLTAHIEAAKLTKK